jgi:hypothetical protein
LPGWIFTNVLNELAAVAPGAPLRDQFTGINFQMHEEDGCLLLKSGAFDWPDERISKNRRKGLLWHVGSPKSE